MSKLWLFGCSFSVDYPRHFLNNVPFVRSWKESENFYTKMLAKKLNAKLHNSAISGSSLGWMMYQSMQHRHEFAEDDYIIFQTTALDRGFLTKENPRLSKISNISKRDKSWASLTNKQQEGYTFYLLDMHDKDILMTQFQAWLHGIAYYTKHLRVQPLLTNAWDLERDIELPDKWRQSKGFLYELSVGEFNVTPMEFRKWLQSNGQDPRINHFSSPNHYKITDIYYKALTDKNYIPDFTTLEQNIYDELPRLGMSTVEWIK